MEEYAFILDNLMNSTNERIFSDCWGMWSGRDEELLPLGYRRYCARSSVPLTTFVDYLVNFCVGYKPRSALPPRV